MSDWWQSVRAYWGNPETLEDYEKILEILSNAEEEGEVENFNIKKEG